MGKESESRTSANSLLAVSKGLIFYFFLLVITIISLEAIFDLKRAIFWLRIATMLDLALIGSYFLFLVNACYSHRYALAAFMRERKGEFLYSLLIIAVLFMPRMAAALIIVRLLLWYGLRLLKTDRGRKLLASINLRPSQTLMLSFLVLIGAGTLLLMLPAATPNGRGASFINALFTMTSASCVAGLSVYNLGADFSRFGQAVILLGMQAGGIGIMALSAVFAVLIGGRIAGRRQLYLRETLDLSSPENLSALIKSIALSTFSLELIGATALFLLWRDEILPLGDRLWWAIFHAVSAFCNSGLALFPNSLESFVDDPLTALVIIFLCTAGGLGFFVLRDLADAEVWVIKKPRAVWDRLQIQTRVVIVAYLLLDLGGLLIFLFFEYDGVLYGLSLPSKISAAFFNVVNMRSAGFSIVSLGTLAAPSVVFCVIFMFIGAAPGGTGGGIKVTTAAVCIMALRAMLRGRPEVEIMGRRLPYSTVNRSVSIVLVAALFLAVSFTFLLASQTLSFERLLFETVSAFGTVGLSMNATASLNSIGKLLIIMVMYVGRVGPLTIALAIGETREHQAYQLPTGRMAVG